MNSRKLTNFAGSANAYVIMHPRYEHACDTCNYLGSTGHGGDVLDWYLCRDTVIARASDRGEDYWSTPISIIENDAYLTALDPKANNSLAPLFSYHPMYILARFMVAQQLATQKVYYNSKTHQHEVCEANDTMTSRQCVHRPTTNLFNNNLE